MTKNVFANGMEISAKASANKSPAAMPDVCLTPPSPPAGPIPIPYPNTGVASDTADGSKSVKIGKKEVGLKNKSKYKKSTGDEAATNSQGAGVVSHKIKGATKFTAWSMDVKIEGKNVTRHLDMTMHNHGSPPNMAVIVSAANMKIEAGEPLNCEELDAKNQEARDSEVVPSANGKPMTLTTASRTDAAGKTKFMKATDSTSTNIRRGAQNSYQGANYKDTMSCTDQSAGGNQRRNHTEPKLIEPEFAGGGSITMKIHHAEWKKVKGKIVRDPETGKPSELLEDAMPCDQCKKAICAASTCEPPFEIKLCNDKNEAVEPACNDDGTPQPEGAWAARGLA